MSKESTREQVLAAAARLFRERGYERTTVRDLADAIGMWSGSVFYHFKTKDELLASVMQRGFELALAHVDETLDKRAEPSELFRALVLAHLQVLLVEARDEMAVALREWDSLSHESRTALVPLRDAYEERFQRVIAEAASEDAIPVDVDLYRLFLLGALNWTVQWYQPGGALAVSELASRFGQFAIRAAP